MKNIRISRYDSPAAGYVGAISPEGGEWTVFVAADGVAQLFERRGIVNVDGREETAYELVGATSQGQAS